MNPAHQLGDLQLAIMRVLWDRQEASAAEVHEALAADRGLAPTTIATMLVKLEKKGAVAHRVDGRRFLYQPLVSEPVVRRSMLATLTERLFGGEVTALVAHLLAEHDIDRRELAELEALLASHGRDSATEDAREDGK
jgi:predicted transcriptional regulator